MKWICDECRDSKEHNACILDTGRASSDHVEARECPLLCHGVKWRRLEPEHGVVDNHCIAFNIIIDGSKTRLRMIDDVLTIDPAPDGAPGCSVGQKGADER